jgi:hypothetical protein
LKNNEKRKALIANIKLFLKKKLVEKIPDVETEIAGFKKIKDIQLSDIFVYFNN